jgi:hypothetical protein
MSLRVCVAGQSSKEQVSSFKDEKMFLLSSFRPISIFQLGSPANQVISLPNSHPISFFHAGISTNQVFSLS